MVGTSETLWTVSKTVRYKKSPLSLLMLGALISPVSRLLLFSLSATEFVPFVVRNPTVRYKKSPLSLLMLGALISPVSRLLLFSLSATEFVPFVVRNPTEEMDSEWKPHTLQKPYHLKINNDLRLMEGRILDKRIAFWEDIQNRFKRIG